MTWHVNRKDVHVYIRSWGSTSWTETSQNNRDFEWMQKELRRIPLRRVRSSTGPMRGWDSSGILAMCTSAVRSPSRSVTSGPPCDWSRPMSSSSGPTPPTISSTSDPSITWSTLSLKLYLHLRTCVCMCLCFGLMSLICNVLAWKLEDLCSWIMDNFVFVKGYIDLGIAWNL